MRTMKPKLFVTLIDGDHLEISTVPEHRALLEGTAQWLGDDWQLEPYDRNEDHDLVAKETGFESELYYLGEQDDPEETMARIVVDLIQSMFADGPQNFTVEVTK